MTLQAIDSISEQVRVRTIMLSQGLFRVRSGPRAYPPGGMDRLRSTHSLIFQPKTA